MLLHEKDDPERNDGDNKDVTNLEEFPQVWMFRANVSVDHLTQMLNTKENTCSLLRLFLNEVYQFYDVPYS